ncbi:RagB/SusD family nutrient uptake outer membrane protein [Chryseolinea lacunae]|uniref:RagB/SusD family nutrient uptake outer membrane protein n=1 Tax=Chryseolinea lacunae TaxID=2801331 RepID=A0ABS1KYV0_9BACT|nr:RagB/SusD family nutrient uptake outer membrane protein [Chryseolinea lacunae]MBL0744646.1 RagB/SusD family nutrient uptake outer membrane protein [Chryseolinea lacunae]
MKKVLLLTIVLVSTIIVSCNETLLDTKNPNVITSDAFYTTLDQIGTSVNAIYAVFQGNRLVGREYFFIHDLRSDEMKAGGGQLEVPRAQLLNGSHTYTNSVSSDVYKGLFTMVHRANAVIVGGGALKVSAADQPLLDRYIAEAKFLRGFAYYTLGALWGGVPLYDRSGADFSDAKPRSTQAETFAFALADANAASAVLPTTYGAADLGRASKGAALTLAGKINLCIGDYAAAKTALEAVKNLGVYSLVGNYFNNFTEEAEYNSESVFEVGFLDTGYGWDASGNGTSADSWVRSQEYSAVGWANLIPSDKLIAEYEDDDPRLTDSFWFPGDKFANGTRTLVTSGGDGKTIINIAGDNSTSFKGSNEKIRWKKYSIMYKTDPGGFNVNVGINYRLWRYADVLMLLAECENEVGTAANAIGYLNQIRNRASVSMPNYGTAAMDNAGFPVSSKAEILKAIQHERFIELAGEEIRNIDILRWRANGKLTGPDPISYFQPNKYELLPIPQDEFNTNAKFTPASQNPGYTN